jgi:hypothetical protein
MAAASPKELAKQIIPAFSKEILASIPEDERHNYECIKIFPIGLLVKADWNYKGEDKEMSDKLRANIKRNGQIENIHVRKLSTGYYEVVNGNHRYDEMIALGRSTVFVYDHGKCTKEEAIRKCIETNETVFHGDSEKLGALLKGLLEITPAAELAITLPYSEDEIKKMTSLVDPEMTAPQVVDYSTSIKPRFALEVTCTNEVEQKKLYDSLTAKGYDCKVLTL